MLLKIYLKYILENVENFEFSASKKINTEWTKHIANRLTVHSISSNIF